MRSRTRACPLVSERGRAQRGILDTSVVIDLEMLDASALPVEVAITSITLAELAAGPGATTDPVERGRRQDRLGRVEAAFDALPFDADAARAYGLVFAVVTASGQRTRGRRVVDLLIAAVALALDLPLYTRNVGDFRALDRLIDVVEV